MSERLANNLFDVAINLYLEKKNIMGLVSLFYGMGNYLVEAFPGAGHDYYSVLKAMYEYKSNNNSINIDSIFTNILDEMIDTIVNPYTLERCYNILVAHLKYEKEGISNVHIDVKDFLVKITNKININTYDNKIQMNQIMEESNDYISQKYGI